MPLQRRLTILIDDELAQDLRDLDYIRHESPSSMARAAIRGHVARLAGTLQPLTAAHIRLIARYGHSTKRNSHHED